MFCVCMCISKCILHAAVMRISFANYGVIHMYLCMYVLGGLPSLSSSQTQNTSGRNAHFTSVTRYVLEDVCYDGFRVQCVDIL